MSTRLLRLCGASTALLLVASQPPTAGSILHVDHAARGKADGTTWIDAFHTIPEALAAAQMGDEIRIAQGIYNPTAGTDRTASFNLRTGVRIGGGFGGVTALDPDELNPQTFVTVLSGDLLGDDDSTDAHSSDNSYHVIQAIGVDRTAVLQDVTISSGNAAGATALPPLEGDGGGLRSIDSSEVIRRCRFLANRGRFGGAVSIQGGDSKPLIESCEFLGNTAVQVVSITSRGGALSVDDAEADVVDCTFAGNRASGTNGRGGAIRWAGNGKLLRCRLEANTAVTGGGGMFIEIGQLLVSRCVFVDNVAFVRAGVSQGGGVLIDTSAPARPEFLGCAFIGNMATLGGGAATRADASELTHLAAPTYSQCMFVANMALVGGAMLNNETFGFLSHSVRVRNCLFARNVTTLGSSGAIHNDFTSPRITNCVFYLNTLRPIAGSPGIVSYCAFDASGGVPGRGNLLIDLMEPLFVDPVGIDGIAGSADDDYHLAPGSRCIDAGNNDVLSPCETDFDGNQRRYDDPMTVDTGVGLTPIVDIGVFEYGSSQAEDCDRDLRIDRCEADCNGNGMADVCEILSGRAADCDGDGIPDECGRGHVVGDLNCDNVVNTLDLCIVLSNWSIPAGSPGCAGVTYCPADINGDGFVDTLDLGILLAGWTL